MKLRIAIANSLVLGALGFVVGCAGISGGAPSSTAPDPGATVEGIPYYELSPFLLVTPDLVGGYTTEVVQLPDTSRIRYVKIHQFLAKADIDLTFKNGALETSAAKIDATAVPKALIAAAVKAAKSSALAGASIVADQIDSTSPQTHDVITPYLFKIDLTSNSPQLIGAGGYVIELPKDPTVRAPSTPSKAGKTGEEK